MNLRADAGAPQGPHDVGARNAQGSEIDPHGVKMPPRLTPDRPHGREHARAQRL
jgi:hypothetical protein